MEICSHEVEVEGEVEQADLSLEINQLVGDADTFLGETLWAS